MITDIAPFTRHILVPYFHHSKFGSFARQLSLHGFHRRLVSGVSLREALQAISPSPPPALLGTTMGFGGTNSIPFGSNSIPFGASSQATGTSSVAIGTEAEQGGSMGGAAGLLTPLMHSDGSLVEGCLVSHPRLRRGNYQAACSILKKKPGSVESQILDGGSSSSSSNHGSTSGAIIGSIAGSHGPAITTMHNQHSRTRRTRLRTDEIAQLQSLENEMEKIQSTAASIQSTIDDTLKPCVDEMEQALAIRTMVVAQLMHHIISDTRDESDPRGGK